MTGVNAPVGGEWPTFSELLRCECPILPGVVIWEGGVFDHAFEFPARSLPLIPYASLQLLAVCLMCRICGRRFDVGPGVYHRPGLPFGFFRRPGA